MGTSKILIDGVGIDLTQDTVAANKMLSGTTAHSSNGDSITGTIPSKAAATYTPSDSDQMIAAGQYLSGAQTVKGDANLIAANIRSGKSIFGVAGSLTPGITPSGTKNITANGTYDVTEFASAAVNVPTLKNPHSQTWDFAQRTERRLRAGLNGSYYFKVDSSEEHHLYLPTDDTCWVNGAFNPRNMKVVGDPESPWHSTVSNVTASGFSLTSGGNMECGILIPFFLSSGQTISITYTRSGSNFGGYVWCDTHGRHVSHEHQNQSGAATSTWTFTAPSDGWLYWMVGKYDSGATVALSNCSVSIS